MVLSCNNLLVGKKRCESAKNRKIFRSFVVWLSQHDDRGWLALNVAPTHFVSSNILFCLLVCITRDLCTCASPNHTPQNPFVLFFVPGFFSSCFLFALSFFVCGALLLVPPVFLCLLHFLFSCVTSSVCSMETT